MKVEVSYNNHYYPWTEVDADGIACWLKGTFFYENEPLLSEDVVHLFSRVFDDSRIDHEGLKNLLLALNGSFALAIETPRFIFCAVDRVRSIPLFYAVRENEALFSDDANHLRDRLNPPLNEEHGAEFLVTGFVTGPDTLFDGISQIQAGEYLAYDKEGRALTTQFYHQFWHKNSYSDSEEELLDRLDETFVRVFQRLIRSTKGRQIVVPLSGGLDSRTVVAMLKRLGVEDVICFSYGKRGNREVEISRQIAAALGYQWHYVEHTKEKLYACYHSDDMERYLKYAGNLVSLPHIQDFLAVKELKERGVIPENAVFVPGHSGDMISGGFIPRDYSRSQSYTFEKFLADNLKKQYNLWKWNKAEFGPLFEKRIQKFMKNISIHDNESCANAIELFDFNGRQAKFIVNSVRAYEFFGYQWQIPLWDTELIVFFLRVPLSYRINQFLYKEYAKRLFVKCLQPLSEIECTTDISGNSRGTKSPVGLTRRVTNIWEHIADVRWGRFFKTPFLSNLYFIRIFDVIKLKDCPVMRRVVLNISNAKRPLISLNGYAALRYLQKRID